MSKNKIYVYVNSLCQPGKPGFLIEAYTTLGKAIDAYPGNWQQTEEDTWEIREKYPYNYLIKELELNPDPFK